MGRLVAREIEMRGDTLPRPLQPEYAIGGYLFAMACLIVAWMVVGHFIPILMAGFMAFVFAMGYPYSLQLNREVDAYRRLRLRLDAPAAIGGRLSASFALPTMLPDRVHAKLLCSRVSGTERRVEPIRALDGEKGKIRFTRAPEGGGRVWLDIDLPEDLPPSSANGLWELHLIIVRQDKNLNTVFDVPVLPRVAGQARAPLRAVPVSAPPPPPMPLDRKPLFVLVGLNLMPLAGVLVEGWRVSDLILLYWAENVLIGLYQVLRIRAAASMEDKPTTIFMFLGHYGLFCALQGGFIADAILGQGPGAGGVLGAVWASLGDISSAMAVLALAASHGYSYVRNYLGRREFEHVDAVALMVGPYKRILVTQIFLMAGGYLLLKTGAGAPATILFVTVKVAFDAWFHRQTHLHSPGAS